MSPIRASELARYPADWPAIRDRILARADHRCEFTRADGSRCDAPNGIVIARALENPETWFFECEALNGLPSTTYRTVRVVLTIAHLNHQPEDCRDENLRAGCQLHHLRYDGQPPSADRGRHPARGEAERGAGVLTLAEARRCVEACAVYLHEVDDSPRAARDLRQAVKVIEQAAKAKEPARLR